MGKSEKVSDTKLDSRPSTSSGTNRAPVSGNGWRVVASKLPPALVVELRKLNAKQRKAAQRILEPSSTGKSAVVTGLMPAVKNGGKSGSKQPGPLKPCSTPSTKKGELSPRTKTTAAVKTVTATQSASIQPTKPPPVASAGPPAPPTVTDAGLPSASKPVPKPTAPRVTIGAKTQTIPSTSKGHVSQPSNPKVAKSSNKKRRGRKGNRSQGKNNKQGQTAGPAGNGIAPANATAPAKGPPEKARALVGNASDKANPNGVSTTDCIFVSETKTHTVDMSKHRRERAQLTRSLTGKAKTLLADVDLVGYLQFNFAFSPRNNETPILMHKKALSYLRGYDLTGYSWSELTKLVVDAIAVAMIPLNSVQLLRNTLKGEGLTHEMEKHNKFLSDGQLGKSGLVNKTIPRAPPK
nr:MAG: hypothetical protein 1 [Tombusviridae sp.]